VKLKKAKTINRAILDNVGASMQTVKLLWLKEKTLKQKD